MSKISLSYSNKPVLGSVASYSNIQLILPFSLLKMKKAETLTFELIKDIEESEYFIREQIKELDLLTEKNLDFVGKCGSNNMHFAAQNCYPMILKDLIEINADGINLKNSHGLTPLAYAFSGEIIPISK